jgi:hypothetical protein
LWCTASGVMGGRYCTAGMPFLLLAVCCLLSACYLLYAAACCQLSAAICYLVQPAAACFLLSVVVPVLFVVCYRLLSVLVFWCVIVASTGQLAVHLLSALYGLDFPTAHRTAILFHQGRPDCRYWNCENVPEDKSQVSLGSTPGKPQPQGGVALRGVAWRCVAWRGVLYIQPPTWQAECWDVNALPGVCGHVRASMRGRCECIHVCAGVPLRGHAFSRVWWSVFSCVSWAG